MGAIFICLDSGGFTRFFFQTFSFWIIRYFPHFFADFKFLQLTLLTFNERTKNSIKEGVNKRGVLIKLLKISENFLNTMKIKKKKQKNFEAKKIFSFNSWKIFTNVFFLELKKSLEYYLENSKIRKQKLKKFLQFKKYLEKFNKYPSVKKKF